MKAKAKAKAKEKFESLHNTLFLKRLSLRISPHFMRIFFFFLAVFFTSFSNLSGQNSPKSISFGISISPQTGSLCNADKRGSSRFLVGYQFGPNLFKKVSNKLTVETGIHFQKANFKQRYHEFQWPADVINGVHDPTRSYEQYEANYFAVGLEAGLNFKLSEKVNTFNVGLFTVMQRVIQFNDKLIINESGYLHYFEGTDLQTENSKTQFLLALAFNYSFVVSHKINFSVGPSFEYSLNDLLRTTSDDVFGSLAGGHPLFVGIRFAYNGRF
jgi:hypothetical protein